jgi:hypothetical protein
LLAAGGGKSVKAGAAIGLGYLPFGFDPSLKKKPLQGGIERAFFNCQHVIGKTFDGLGYAVPVKGGAGEGLEDEHVEGAGKQVRFLHASMYRVSMDRKSTELVTFVTIAGLNESFFSLRVSQIDYVRA